MASLDALYPFPTKFIHTFCFLFLGSYYLLLNKKQKLGVFSLNIDESVSANFGRLWSLWFTRPNKELLKHSRRVWCIKVLNVIINMLLLLTSVQALLNFSVWSHSNLCQGGMIFGIGLRGRIGFQGQSGLLEALCLGRLSYWKSLKADNVINIIKPCAEIFPNADA